MSLGPNLFLVGAPKCGTTALYTYLKDHPAVFFPDEKEPHHFAGEFVDSHRGREYREDRGAYLALYGGAGARHRVRGDASPCYLMAPGSIERILAFDPGARFLAMVRNPVDMAPSLHQQLVVSGVETVDDFERSWRMQDERRASGRPTVGGVDARLFLYRDACALGTQIERFHARVPASRRRTIVFDDLARDAAAVYRDVLRFLDLDDDGRTDFPRVNERLELRWPALARWNRSAPSWNWWIRTKRALGLPRFSVLHVPRTVYTRPAPRAVLPAGLRRELVDTFRPEIERLARACDRDLSGWLDPDGRARSAASGDRRAGR